MGFIFSIKIIVRVIYSGVFKGRQSRHLLRAPFLGDPARYLGQTQNLEVGGPSPHRSKTGRA